MGSYAVSLAYALTFFSRFLPIFLSWFIHPHEVPRLQIGFYILVQLSELS